VLHSCEAADFVIDCAAKLPAQLIITGGGWKSRCGRVCSLSQMAPSSPQPGGDFVVCKAAPPQDITTSGATLTLSCPGKPDVKVSLGA
jgi:hypothetical protein